MGFLRVVLGYVVAVVVAGALAAAFSAETVAQRLEGMGHEVSLSDRLGWYAYDAMNMPMFYIILAVAFLIGFLVAFGLKRILTALAPVAYPLAGFFALMAALSLMPLAFDGIIPIAGARTWLGLIFVSVAGLIGGLLFAMIRPVRD